MLTDRPLLPVYIPPMNYENLTIGACYLILIGLDMAFILGWIP